MRRNAPVVLLVAGMVTFVLAAAAAGVAIARRMAPPAAATAGESPADGPQPPCHVWHSGNVTVAVVEVRAGNVVLHDGRGNRDVSKNATRSDEFFVVGLRVYSSDPGRVTQVGSLAAAARCADANGNALASVTGFGNRWLVAGQLRGTTPLHADAPLGDVLVLQMPARGATHVDVEAPASVVGQPGVIRLRVLTRGLPLVWWD